MQDKEPPASDAPRFYWHNQAEDVTEQGDANSPTETGSQTNNEPIVEFPDDDDEDEQAQVGQMTKL